MTIVIFKNRISYFCQYYFLGKGYIIFCSYTQGGINVKHINIAVKCIVLFIIVTISIILGDFIIAGIVISLTTILNVFIFLVYLIPLIGLIIAIKFNKILYIYFLKNEKLYCLSIAYTLSVITFFCIMYFYNEYIYEGLDYIVTVFALFIMLVQSILVCLWSWGYVLYKHFQKKKKIIETQAE